MRLLPPAGMSPPPVPPADFSGLTDEELRAMEGEERENLEARVQCLRNIHTLLDAAMLQIQQYTTVVSRSVHSLATHKLPSIVTVIMTPVCAVSIVVLYILLTVNDYCNNSCTLCFLSV